MLPASSIVISFSAHWPPEMPFLWPFHPNILLNGIPALMGPPAGSLTPIHPLPEQPLSFPVPDAVFFGWPNVLMNGIPAVTMFCPAIHLDMPPSFTFVASGWADILIG